MTIKIRFWDKRNKKMLYGFGITDNQRPIRENTDGTVDIVDSDVIPMLNTLTKDITGADIWQSDICSADLQMFLMADMPPSMLKVIGVMQYDIPTGTYTLTIHDAPQSMMGKKFQITNIKVIGNAFENGDMLMKEKGNEIKVEVH